MTTFEIETKKYDVDLCRLLSRRLTQAGCVFALAETDDGVSVTVGDETACARLVEALTMLLCRDLMHFELAGYIDKLPLELTEKQAVLADTLRWARAHERLGRIRCALAAYLAETNVLNLEGYMLFRMRDCIQIWREGADRIACEQTLQREYTELMRSLNTYLETCPPCTGELSVCINPDGSCTLTDDSDARIEYVDCSDDGIVSLLVSMAPARLVVYDLSGGTGETLTESIRSAFAGRVRVFR